MCGMKRSEAVRIDAAVRSDARGGDGGRCGYSLRIDVKMGSGPALRGVRNDATRDAATVVEATVLCESMRMHSGPALRGVRHGNAKRRDAIKQTKQMRKWLQVKNGYNRLRFDPRQHLHQDKIPKPPAIVPAQDFKK